MNEEEVEGRSLLDLASIIREARKLGIKLLLIGGYAVAAYTRGYRYTKDIDLLADRPAIGKLKGLLHNLGYSTRDTEFGLAASKRLNQGFSDLHISVGKIHDISTDKDYPFNPALFKNAKLLNVKGYFARTSSLKTRVVDLETLLVLKFMTVGRQKDTVDVLSLLLDRRKEVNQMFLAKRAKAVGLGAHLLNQIRDYARKLREGELDRIWFDVTASRLPHTENREIARFLANLADLLRQQ